MEQAIKVTWLDRGREPQCPPNPAFPEGVDCDISREASVTCKTALPYPARRCGYFLVKCDACGQTAMITTAGRPDDPRSVTLACKRSKANWRDERMK